MGRLRLPTTVLFLSMIGGLELVGASGILLGPLAVRMAVEVRDIVRERSR